MMSEGGFFLTKVVCTSFNLSLLWIGAILKQNAICVISLEQGTLRPISLPEMKKNIG